MNESDLTRLVRLQEKPELFSPGDAFFWDDPYISEQLLAAHLDPARDLASRRPETIERSVEWLVEVLQLHPGDALLDLGCGPGLYTARFAQRGFQVTGIDASRRSIDYAVEYARQHGLEIEYRYQNYLELTDRERYDAAVLIYGDFCPLSPEQRGLLLKNVRRALKPGGQFVLDITTRLHRERYGSRNGWYAAEKGFWRPGWHLVLEQGFDYPEQSIYLDQVIVVEPNDALTLYRMWFQDYTAEAIQEELENGGFTVKSLWSDLVGTPFNENSEWIGVIAGKSDF